MNNIVFIDNLLICLLRISGCLILKSKSLILLNWNYVIGK